MKILVIDDSSLNLKSATLTLVGHDLTLCDDVDEALKLLNIGTAGRAMSKEAPPYDAVLCDLLMLSPRYAQASLDQEKDAAVGYALALTAARTTNAKYILMASMTNHHNHWASGMLDAVSGSSSYNPRDTNVTYTINGKKVAFWHTEMLKVEPEIDCEHCSGKGTVKLARGDSCTCFECGGKGRLLPYAKDWGAMLNALMQD